jgi:hypothetical protein
MNMSNYLRYWVFNEDGELIRKLFSKIECEPYLQAGCTLTVLPKVKQPNPYYQAEQLLQEAPF